MRTIAAPPYRVLGASCSAAELGSAVLSALADAKYEDLDALEARHAADERILELAHAAGVKTFATFERGAKLVAARQQTEGTVIVEPNYRRRGYWVPAPERYWIHVPDPTAESVGLAILTAFGEPAPAG